MRKAAIISPCGEYRYQLSRVWDENGTTCVFIMLNPSTADANEDDPTIRKCVKFAKAWGHGSLYVVNLFAYRATDPSKLKKVNYPKGTDNDGAILDTISSADFIVCAWGNGGILYGRDYEVKELLRKSGRVAHCLKLSKGGNPYHPLYIPDATRPFAFQEGRANAYSS